MNRLGHLASSSGDARPSFARRMARRPMTCFGLMLVFSALGLSEARAQSCGAGETPAAFGFTGGEQTVVVPAGINSATIYLSGGQGGAGRSGAGTIGGSPLSPGGAGGLGGRVRGTLALTPGAVLSIWVGGQGSQAVNPGGIGEGVDGIGGGATDLRVGGNTIGNRVGVAGGGGGGGNAGWSTANVIAGGNGGVGGGGVGGAGATVPGGGGPFGGGGGAVGTGGAGGAGCGSFPATAGSAVTGDGGDAFNFSGSFPGAGFGGGGGGGATIGAGGGGAGVGTVTCQQNWNGGGGGGAGGSSGATGLTAVTINNGVQAGNGAALICFSSPTYAVSGSATGQTGSVTLGLNGTNPVTNQQVVVAQAATSFIFPTRLAQGASFTVSVLSAPANQVCNVVPASGGPLNADFTTLALTCSTVVTVIDPPTLPNATYAALYSQTLTASSSAGVNPHSFAVVAGALPGGLTLQPDGTLAGTPTAAGSFNSTVQATSSNGFTGTRAYTLVVDRATQIISNFIATPANPVFAPGGTFGVSATGGGSTSPLVFASTTPALCTVGGTTVTMLGAGNCGLTANQAGDANHEPAPEVTLVVPIALAAQAITNFVATPANPVFAPGGSFNVSATGGGSSSPVVFASTSPAVCTVSGDVVTTLAAGDCSLTANQAGDANYEPAPEALLLVPIARAAQIISDFVATPANPVFVPSGTFTVSATGGDSTSPVVFASTSPAVCTVSGDVVTMLAAGSCALTANQAGDANYEPAPEVTLTVAIAVGEQVITDFVADPANPFYAPDGTFGVSATGGGSTSPVVFASTSPAVCTVVGDAVTMLAAGTCALTANQAGDDNYGPAPEVTLDVEIALGAQLITDFIATPANPVFEPGGTFTVSATGGGSTSPVVFASESLTTCTVSGTTVTMLAAGACELTANQAGDANYEAAPEVTLSVSIGNAGQVITDFVATPANPVFEPNGTFTVSATGGGSTSPVVFAGTSPDVCTVSGSTVTMVSAGLCALTANQAGDANHDPAPEVTLAVQIANASQIITDFVATPANPVFEPNGTFDVSANGGPSTSPVVFASTSLAVCVVNGSTVTMLAAGSCVLTANQAGDGNYDPAPEVTLTVAIASGGQTITDFVATPANPVYAPNGTFTVSATGGGSTSPVVFASTSPTVCTVSGDTVTMLAAGSCTLTANQAGDANYDPAPEATLTVTIGATTPTLTWIPDIQRIVSDPDFDLPDPQSDSPGAFSFTSSDDNVAVVVGRTVMLVGPGVATLVATQAATGEYLEASIGLTLTVSGVVEPPQPVPVNGWIALVILLGLLLLAAHLAMRRRVC